MSNFTLHPQLLADTHHVCDLALCRVLLMNDARYPWCILVPRRENAREAHRLTSEDQASLWQEVARVSATLEQLTGAHKMNVAALGNLVPQLHVHVIARQETDAAWPGPVWGLGVTEAYDAERAAGLCEEIAGAISAA